LGGLWDAVALAGSSKVVGEAWPMAHTAMQRMPKISVDPAMRSSATRRSPNDPPPLFRRAVNVRMSAWNRPA